MKGTTNTMRAVTANAIDATLAAQLQAFAHAVTATEAPTDTAAWLRPTPQGQPARLGIYRHAFRSRLSDALRDNYPILHRVLGDEAFDTVALGFIERHPSRHPSIRWFGDALPAHLQSLAEAGELPHPALPDLARMEWALGTAFDAADAPLLSVEDLIALAPADWPTLRLHRHPSVRLLTLDWSVEALWHALNDDPDAETAAPERNAHRLLVWRSGTQTRWRSAIALEGELLQAAFAGECFADLCQRAATSEGEQAAAAVAGYLRVWVEAGLFACSPPDIPCSPD